MRSFSEVSVLIRFTLLIERSVAKVSLFGFLKTGEQNRQQRDPSSYRSICSELQMKFLEVICSELPDKEVGCREALTLRTYAALL